MRSLLAIFLASVAAAQIPVPALPDAAKIASLEADMPYPTPGACTITATTSAEFTAALSNISSGGTICLAAQSTGAVFMGKFRATQANAEYVTVRSTRAGELPEGRRINTTTDRPKLAKIVSGDSAHALFVTARAARWRFVGLEITTASSNHSVIVRLGANGCVEQVCQTSIADNPQRIIIDRAWIHGLPLPARTGIGVIADADYVVVRDSVIDAIHRADSGDTQAMLSGVSQGPMIIQNNLLSAAGENIMIGGDGFPYGGVVPSDIIFRGNRFWKDPAWRGNSNAPVKNDFELKTGRRVLIEGNELGPYWSGTGSQYYAIVMKSANQNCNSAGSTNQVKDITFRYNRLVDVAQAFAIGRVAACDNVQAGSRDFYIHDNLILGLGYGHTQDGFPKVFLWAYPEKIADGTREYARNVRFEHNTVGSLTGFGVNSYRYIHHETQGTYVRDSSFRSNILPGSFFSVGTVNNESTISSRFLPIFDFTHNLIVGAKAVFAGNPNFQRSAYAGLFVNEAAGNYTLASPTAYPGADGRPAGADIAKVNACTAGVIDGTWSGCSAPPATTITLAANGSYSPIAVHPGDPVTLTWSGSSTTSCEARASNPYGLGIWFGSKTAAGGSQVINPSVSSTYYLDCAGPGGSVSASIAVAVSKVCAEPPL